MTNQPIRAPRTREDAHALLDRVRDGSSLVPTRLIELALRLTGDLPAQERRELAEEESPA